MRNIEGRSLLVHVSKEDYPYISMQKKQLVSESVSSSTEVDIVEDASLSKNECFIETEAGIFDCGLGTQLSELSQKLKLLSYEKQQ
jgi:flagellar assembly protein FliH